MRKNFEWLRGFAFVFIFVALSGCAAFSIPHDEGLRTLAAQGKEEAAKEAALRREEENYKKIKDAIAYHRLKPGMSAAQIENQFGEPVVVLGNLAEERWLYKGRNNNWFAAPKIYLVFNVDRQFVRVECANAACRET